MKGHTGAARLALQTGAPVVPMAHWGAQEVFPRYAKRFHIFPRKTVRVLVGEPVDLSAFRDKPMDRTTLAEATELIMDAVTGLLETLRGEQAPAERWDPANHQQAKHGRFVERGLKPGSAASTEANPTGASEAPDLEGGK
jgi:1-acyl-sn-glycerol-3-phosphate acyltransferase